MSQMRNSTEYDAEDNDLITPFVDHEKKNTSKRSHPNTRTWHSFLLEYKYALMILAVAVVTFSVGIYFFVEANEGGSDDDHVELNTCYLAPSCQNVNIKQVSDKLTGFTNNTGFNSVSGTDNTCCNICYPGMNQTVCFAAAATDNSQYHSVWGMENLLEVDANCSKKTGNMDYDFLMLDQIYLPQWCAALAEGHDPTLSHLAGSRCTPEVTSGQPQLNIHGLWPNYYHGYPQCCLAAANHSSPPRPLNPLTVQNDWPIYDKLQTVWYDPTTSSNNLDDVSCATCYVLNHEWEKHGTCFSPLEPEAYFSQGLYLNSLLSNATASITRLNGTVVDTATIAALYPQTANVICDAISTVPEGVDPSAGVFVELQTCYTLTVHTFTTDELLGVLNDKTSSSSSFSSSPDQQVLLFPVSSKRVLAEGVPAVQVFLASLPASDTPAGVYFDLGVYTAIDCPAASASQFTAPCPPLTYVGNFQV